MNTAVIDKIASAVLYEGYMLYPYRRCVKNHKRWTFGCVYPRAHSESTGGAEPCVMQTQCLVAGAAAAQFTAELRFLHLVDRQVAQLFDGQTLKFVDSLEIDGVRYESWQEAVERRIVAGPYPMDDLLAGPRRTDFHFPATRETESIGASAGVIVRKQEAIQGAIETTARMVADGLCCVTVRIDNHSQLADEKDGAATQSLLSTHTVLSVEGRQFVSLTDPPVHWREVARALQNIGAWPVLVGDETRGDTMLSSPIILYDYPQIAPESAGDLFDSTEIDEILALRVMTLTEEEKREMAGLDDRTRAILARTETLPEEHWHKLHGAIRGLKRVAHSET